MKDRVDKPLLLGSGAFCMAPWRNAFVSGGKVTPCCWISDPSAQGDLRSGGFEAAANLPFWRGLRLDMLAGRRNPACTTCYSAEKEGLISLRQRHNSDHEHDFKAVSSTGEDGACEGFRPTTLQVSFSNVCNFRCRTCNPRWSSAWREEALRLGDSVSFDYLGDAGYGASDRYPTVTLDKAMMGRAHEVLASLLPGLRAVQFSGGEPLIDPDHLRFLRLLAGKKAFGVLLGYNTNLSVLEIGGADIPSIWRDFDVVRILASVDGVDERGAYLRRGFDWSAFVKNRRRLADVCPRAMVGVMATVSAMNALHLPDLFQRLMDDGLVEARRIDSVSLVREPSEFSVQVLPERLKSRVRERYAAFSARAAASYGSDADGMRAALRGVVAYMMERDGSALLPEFRKRTAALDAFRGEEFSAVFPELREMLVDDD